MLDFLKKRLAASIEHRIKIATAPLQKRVRSVGWDGTGDPLEFHQRAAIAALSEGVAAIYGYDVEGDIAEFGTMTGATASGLGRAIANCDLTLRHCVEAYRQARRRLFLFDSFVGLPASDVSSVDGQSPHVLDGVWSAGSLQGISVDSLAEAIQQHLSPERIKIVPGWFSHTLPQLPDESKFALIHIDSDLYQSAIAVLDTLFGRGMIVPGCYIYFDDWNCNRADPSFGERRAWAECVGKYEVNASDLGGYGLFARRFVVHGYRGCPRPEGEIVIGPQDAAAAVSDGMDVAVSGGMEVVGTPSDQGPPTSTDIYDHQAASRHYHEQTGMGDMDSSFLPIYERCRAYSMTSAERMYALYKAVQYIQEAEIEGDIVECGVWRGGSMMVVAETMKLFPGPDRILHLFDTYEGLPTPTAEDVDVWGHAAMTWWQQKRTSETSSDWARSHLDEVRANMAMTGMPPDRIKFVKGMVEDTLPGCAPPRIALMRLDTDWYASTKHELVHLFPRLSRNGVMIVDDYGHFRGARQAVDEYWAETKLPLMISRIDYTGRLVIKTCG